MHTENSHDSEVSCLVYPGLVGTEELLQSAEQAEHQWYTAPPAAKLQEERQRTRICKCT